MCDTSDALRRFAAMLDEGAQKDEIGPLIVLAGWSMMKRTPRKPRP